MPGKIGKPRWVLLLVLVVAGLILYPLRYVLIPFVLAAGLTYIISPLVNRVERRSRLPRPAVVFLFYTLIIGPLFTFGYLYGPMALAKMEAFFNEIPWLVHRLVEQLLGGEHFQVLGRTITSQAIADQILATLKRQIATPEGMVGLGKKAAAFFFGIILTLVVLFYFLASRDLLARTLRHLTPREEHWRVNKLVAGVDFLLGRYLRGILLIIIYASTTAYLGLQFIFHLPYALPLALLTGLLEVLPVVGPILSMVLTGFIAMLTGGFWLVVQVGGFYGFLRVTLDNVLAPLILGWAAILHPVMILFAFLTGGTLFGILGLLLAVPVTAITRMVLEGWDDYFG